MQHVLPALMFLVSGNRELVHYENAMSRHLTRRASGQRNLLDPGNQIPPCPPFFVLLKSPLVKEQLPRDFVLEEEAEHLTDLWSQLPGLWRYDFETFVHAGGSGMVFRVRKTRSRTFESGQTVRGTRPATSRATSRGSSRQRTP